MEFEKLGLKKHLFETRDMLMNTLINPCLPDNERIIYERWLQSVQSTIGMCTARNKF